MDNNLEDRIVKNFKMNIAIDNFNRSIQTDFFENRGIRKKYVINKKILVTVCTIMLLVSGIGFATNINNIRSYFRGLGDGVDSAIEHGYILTPQTGYIKSDVDIIDTEELVINGDSVVDIEIANFLMDNYNMSVEFNFKFDDNIDEYVNLDDIHNIELNDLIIRDEENRILYAGNDREHFELYCKEYDLNYVFGENNADYINSGLNNFTLYNSKDDNTIKMIYNIYADEYPRSKTLYFSFGKIILISNDNKSNLILEGNWQIDLNVPEIMYNRSIETYKVISCSNENFNVYSSIVSETGFEIGLIINNIEKPEFPKELRKKIDEIFARYENQIDKTNANQELNDLLRTSPYKEMNDAYYKKESPINLRGGINSAETKADEKSYVENANGDKFFCTMNPSRNYKKEWLDGNKYGFYETFSMTKYEASDKIKVILNYYGEEVVIELEKNK